MGTGRRAGALLFDSKLALICPARSTILAKQRALLNYTATPNLINLEIVLARTDGQSVGRPRARDGRELARGRSVGSYLENSKRVILVPDKNDGGVRSRPKFQAAPGTQLKPRP